MAYYLITLHFIGRISILKISPSVAEICNAASETGEISGGNSLFLTEVYCQQSGKESTVHIHVCTGLSLLLQLLSAYLKTIKTHKCYTELTDYIKLLLTLSPSLDKTTCPTLSQYSVLLSFSLFLLYNFYKSKNYKFLQSLQYFTIKWYN